MESVFTLLRIILGDFDFPGMRAAQPALGPFYFFTYVIFIFFILLVRYHSVLKSQNMSHFLPEKLNFAII